MGMKIPVNAHLLWAFTEAAAIEDFVFGFLI